MTRFPGWEAKRPSKSSAERVSCRPKAATIVHLEVGEPDFDTPKHVKEAGKAAIDANFTHYAPNPGIMDLREVIAAYATRFRNLKTPYESQNVVVAPGAKPMIWNLLSAVLDPGDEMLYARSRLSDVCQLRRLSQRQSGAGAAARVDRLEPRHRRAQSEDLAAHPKC